LEKKNSLAEAFPYSSCRIAIPVTLLLLLVLLVPVRILDQSLFSAINAIHAPSSDPFWLTVTTLGDGLVLSIILGAFIVINPRVTAMGLFLLLVTSAMVHALKWGFPTLRPASVIESVHVIGPVLRSGAFPSGHAASAMATCLAVAHYCPSRAAGAGIILLGLLVSVSRIFVGAHFPSDVLGGIILSLGLYYLAVCLPWPQWESVVHGSSVSHGWAFRSLFCLELLAALFALFVYAPFFADAPITVILVATTVLVVLIRGWRRISRAGNRR